MTASPSTDLGDIFDWIAGIDGLADLPALVVSPNATEPELRVYPRGLNRPDDVRKYPIFLEELDLPKLDEILCGFYEGVVCSPGGGRKCAKLWANAAQNVPVQRPEKAIQDELYRFLRAALPRLHVTEEEDTPLGRFDLQLSGPTGGNPHTYVNHAIIELKVLTSGNKAPPLRNNQTVKQQIVDGAQQAASYRLPPRAARLAVLGCYDMRPLSGLRGDSCLAHIRAYANAQAVELRRWPLFPTVKALRQHRAPVHQAD